MVSAIVRILQNGIDLTLRKRIFVFVTFFALIDQMNDYQILKDND